MLRLTPEWADSYPIFWEEMNKRVEVFIQLRFVAISSLILFVLFLNVVLKIDLSNVQIFGFSIIIVLGVVTNLFWKKLSKKQANHRDRFNAVHHSLLQIISDLILVFLLVYLTGGIESPLFILFVFHLIIGSLFIPNKYIYFLASLLVLNIVFFSLLEFFSILPHNSLISIYSNELYQNPRFIVMVISVFTVVIFVSVYTAGTVASKYFSMQHDLLKMVDALQLAEKEKQQYIMAVVHEVKSPLAAINSYLNLILANILGPVRPKIHEILLKSRNRSDDAVELINKILNVSNARLTGKLNIGEVDLVELILYQINKSNFIAETKSIEIIFQNDSHSPILFGDKEKLALVFSNILGNSVKYTLEKGRVIVSLRGNYKLGYTIVVEDNGIGIPEKDQKNLFQDFYRASNARAGKIEGTGMGLSLVKQFIELHKGEINITSPSSIGNEINKGTRVEIKLKNSE